MSKEYSTKKEENIIENLDDLLLEGGLTPIQVTDPSVSVSIDKIIKEYYAPRIVYFDPLASIGFPKRRGSYFSGYLLSYKDGDFNKLMLPIEKYQEIIDTIRVWKRRMEDSCINYSGESIEAIRNYLSSFYEATTYVISGVEAVGFVDVVLLEKPETQKLLSEAKDLQKDLEQYNVETRGRNENKIDRFGLTKYYKEKEDEIRKLTGTEDKKNNSIWLQWWAWDLAIPLFLKDALVSNDQGIQTAAGEYVAALLIEQQSPTPKEMKFVFSNVLRELEILQYNYSSKGVLISSRKQKYEDAELQEVYDRMYAARKGTADEVLSVFGDLAISGKLLKFFISNPKGINKKEINILNRFLIDEKLITV